MFKWGNGPTTSDQIYPISLNTIELPSSRAGFALANVLGVNLVNNNVDCQCARREILPDSIRSQGQSVKPCQPPSTVSHVEKLKGFPPSSPGIRPPLRSTQSPALPEAVCGVRGWKALDTPRT